MPQIINTNIASLNAQRNLDKSQSSNQQALQRLSSGLRINSAKDDAAGLSISTRFTSQIKGLNVAVRNAGDGIALAQTAEGALGSMNDSLQRIRELAVQSSNATNSDVDRDALQSEVDQLVAEITRTSEETDFNGRKLLDGSFSASFQVGANAGQTIDVTIGQLTADKLGVGTSNGVSAQGSASGLQNGDLSINGISIDPSKSGSDTASTTNQAASAIAKVDTINAKTDLTGVTAKVNTNVASGAEMTAGLSTGTVTLNGVDIDIATGGLDTSADRDSVISSLNAKADQTGVTARDGGDAGGVILEAADGRNIEVTFGGDFDTSNDATAITDAEIAAAASATGLSSGTSYGGYTLTSNDGSDIVISGGAGTGTGNIANSGLSAGTFSGRESAITSSATNTAIKSEETASSFTTGDLSIGSTLQINATNNTFELSVNGEDFQTLQLSSTFDADGAGALGAGEYDNASSLAAHITEAIANDVNFQGKVTVSGDDTTGELTFTTVDKGADSAVVARTGTGNLSIATGNVEAAGVTGISAVTDDLSFIFDGTNSTGAGTTLSLTIAGGGTGAVTDESLTGLSANQTDAQAFADEVNSAIAGNANLSGKVVASVSEDGTTVSISSALQKTNVDGSGNFINSVSVGAATDIQPGFEATQVQHLSNGDAVLVDPTTYFASIAAGDDVGLAVDGAPVGELDFAATTNGGTGTSLATATGGDVDDKVSYLNDLFADQVAGAGITASNVGGQILLSSDSNGSVKVTAATVGTPVLAAADIASTDADDRVSVGVAGTAVTGSFNVADGTGDDAVGTFLAADADGLGTDFEIQASPLVITAGVNDTFTISVDGGADANITIPAGSFATLGDLATALDNATGAGSLDALAADVSVDPDDASKLKFVSRDASVDGSIALKDGGIATTDGAFAISGGQTAGALVTQVVTPNVLETGDLTINGTAISGSDAKDDTASDTNALTSDGAASGIAVATAINKSTAETGVTATVNATSLTGGGDNSTATKADVNSTGTIYVNNVETAAVTITGDESRDRQSAIDVINAVSGQTGVTAEDNGESITLTAADGRNVSVAIDNKLAENAAAVPSRDSSNFGVSIGLDSSKDGIGEADITGTASTYANTAGTTNSTVTLTSASAIEVSNGANGADELAQAGFSAGTFGGGEDGQFLKDVDITTVEGAASAITAIDNAIGQVASQRADLGAIQNRMESTVSNLQVTSENLNAANSRIQDADFAAETAELQRTNVLQQAGISVLAQANAAGQQVLSLLG
jgi:flagellin